MKLIHRWLILSILFQAYSCTDRALFRVSAFGAHVDDHIDDTHAIQAAVDTAITHGPNTVVVFGSGTYTLTSTINLFNCVNLTITGQGAEQTLLVSTSPTMIFQANLCDGLTIAALALDYDPLPFTGGYIVTSTSTYLDVQITAPHRADVGRQVAAVFRYDPMQMRPAFGPNAYEIYQTPPVNETTSLVSPGVLRIPLTSSSQFAPGDAVVVRYAFTTNAVFAQDVTDCTVQSVTIHTAWAMGFVTLRARRLNVVDYRVVARDGRWMSTVMDCMHFMDSREFVHLADSRCEAMGDDGLNVLTFYFNATRIVNSSALVLQTKYSVDLFNFGLGTRLQFSTKQQPFTVYTTAVITSSAAISPSTQLFTFDRALNVTVGDWVCVADAPSLTIRNFTVTRNRARGALLETRNVHLTNSVFNRTSGPALLFQPSLYWLEGLPAQNVTLAENLYINCNEGLAQEGGVLTVLPDPTQLAPVIADVRIISSTFLIGSYSQGLLQIANGMNVSITDSYIATNSSTPFISICNSQQISARNNTVVNVHSTMDEYYRYDTTEPCDRSLSNSINLPPSAFNSSFAPPVTPAELF